MRPLQDYTGDTTLDRQPPDTQIEIRDGTLTLKSLGLNSTVVHRGSGGVVIEQHCAGGSIVRAAGPIDIRGTTYTDCYVESAADVRLSKVEKLCVVKSREGSVAIRGACGEGCEITAAGDVVIDGNVARNCVITARSVTVKGQIAEGASIRETGATGFAQRLAAETNHRPARNISLG